MSAVEVEQETDYDKCGTYAGWNMHANREYQRARRQDPDRRAKEMAANYARERALWRLARLHPTQFRALVAEEQRT